MRRLLLSLSACSLLPLAGCHIGQPVKRVERPVNVTHEVAFGDYRRVYNTTYHILNRYGVVQRSSYRYGEITALVSEDNSLFDKTRRTIQARIFSGDDFWEVECRVLIAVEDSEVATFPGQFQPRYSWKTIASDPRLEVRLNNEIRAALSGGAWQAKEPLRPEPRVPAAGPGLRAPGDGGPAQRARPREETGEVSDPQAVERVASNELPSPEAFERLGIQRLRSGAFAGAARAFRAALDVSAADAPFAHFLLAQALFSQGDFTGALASFEEGSRVNPDWAQADVDLRALYGDGRDAFDARLGELDGAARDDAPLYLLLGYVRYFSGDAEGALAALDRYLTVRPEAPLARSYRALARARVDRAHGLESF